MPRRSGSSNIESSERIGCETTCRPRFTSDLLPSERRFTAAMRELWFGSYKSLRIERGELTLSPWPTTVRDVKFGASVPTESSDGPAEFELKRQVAEFFEYVRSVDTGEIRCLTCHNGLPFSMEIEYRSNWNGGRSG